MYRDSSNVFLFDAWVEQSSGLHTVQPPTAGKPDKSEEPSTSPPTTTTTPKKTVEIDEDADINIIEYTEPYKPWREVQRGKKSNKKEDAKLNDEIVNFESENPFGRLVPSWP